MLRTAERGPYPPGQEVEPGQAFIMETVPTGGQKAQQGYFDDDDGWFIEFNALGMDIVVRKGGVDYPEQWGTWEGDEIVGNSAYAAVTNPNSPGNFRFKPSDGYIYQFPFTWYGYGPCEFNIQLTDKINGQWIKTIAARRPKGETSIDQPHLPLRCDVITEEGDDAFECKITGRQISVAGDYDPIFREPNVEVLNITGVDDTAWVPVTAIKRRSTKPYATTKINSVDIFSDDPVRVMFMYMDSIENPASYQGFEFISTTETLLEYSTNPSANENDGVMIKQFLAKSGDTLDEKNLLRMPFIEDKPVVIFLRKVPGRGINANITLNVELSEEW